jgi:hypothetical protein
MRVLKEFAAVSPSISIIPVTSNANFAPSQTLEDTLSVRRCAQGYFA